MSSISRFYGIYDNIRIVADIPEGRSDISLRVIDWFVTNYAKRKNIIHQRNTPSGYGESSNRESTPGIMRRGPESVSFFSVYLSYREELRIYSKQQFDPFRRNEHIAFRYGDGCELETTVGQLNFFKWAVENGIIDYIRDHRKEIEEAMSSEGGRSKGKAKLTADNAELSVNDPLQVSRDGDNKDGRRKYRKPTVVIAKRSVISFD
jgi:hypothetical protein